MTSNKLIESQILQEDDPDYGPLEAVLGPDACDEYEWRAEVELADHTHIQAYKYAHTGHYLHLSADGRAYLFIGYDRYIRVDTSDTTRHVRASLPTSWERTRKQPP